MLLLFYFLPVLIFKLRFLDRRHNQELTSCAFKFLDFCLCLTSMSNSNTRETLMCNTQEQTWLHIGSISLELTFVPCCLGLLRRALHFCLPSQQKNVAYSLKYVVHKSPFSRFCLPGWTFKAISLFVRIDIKMCRTENNICLLEGL